MQQKKENEWVDTREAEAETMGTQGTRAELPRHQILPQFLAL